jgi:hypothetical protein
MRLLKVEHELACEFLGILSRLNHGCRFAESDQDFEFPDGLVQGISVKVR